MNRSLPEKLTVLIPVLNERHNLAECLGSLRSLADEILIADSGSTDGTLELAQELGGCHIIERTYGDAASFKNWAISHARNCWVLIVHADERLTPELAAEIRCALENPAHDGYRIPRRNHFFGHEIKHGGWSPDLVLRLFYRDLANFDEESEAAELVVRGNHVARLKSPLLHYNCRTIDQYLRKLDRYSSLAAQRSQAAGHRTGYFELLCSAPWRFFKTYVVRLGFLDGTAGLVLCLLSAFYATTRAAKLWAMESAPTAADTVRFDSATRATSAKGESSNLLDASQCETLRIDRRSAPVEQPR